MHTYRMSQPNLWTVGYYDPCGASAGMRPQWNAIKDFESEWMAARFTSYLNGGSYCDHFENI